MPASRKSEQSKVSAKKSHSKAFERLLRFCDDLHAGANAASLLTIGAEVESKADAVEETKRQFQDEIGDVPFLALVILWAKEMDALMHQGERRVGCILELIEQGILPYRNKKSALITLDEIDLGDHAKILDAIRSVNEWSVEKQEELVSIYTELTNKLSQMTCGLISVAYDLDRSLSAKRRVSFELYLKILKNLAERERILAKIFYLGGSRTLDEVLSLKIEDVDFKNNSLKISGEQIVYPGHVLHDLKYFIGRRTQGFVFINRTGEKIDLTVPYKALKNVTTKLDLDPSFTFKDLVKIF